MHGAQSAQPRSAVLLCLAILTLGGSVIVYRESGTGVTLFEFRDQGLVTSILVACSVILSYAWWQGRGPTSVKSLGRSLLISSGLVWPFLVLQLANRRTFHEECPVVLFGSMSLHALIIVLLLTPALRCLRANASLRALTPGHWAGLILGGWLVVGYVGLVVDQFPCFLGVPNCD